MPLLLFIAQISSDRRQKNLVNRAMNMDVQRADYEKPAGQNGSGPSTDKL